MSGLRAAVSNWIGTNRDSAAVRCLHRSAEFVESAWNNEGASFAANGEQKVIDLLKPAGLAVALDVGANFGDWSLAACAAWPDCTVHAFEVAPPTFATLSTNVALSTFASRVNVHHQGLSDCAANAEMYYFPDHPELTCDLPRHKHVRVPFNAELITGDSVITKLGLNRVDFVKIDVEGAEHRVLKGFSTALASGKIQCLQFEYGAFSIQTRFLLADYYSLLEEAYWIGKVQLGGVEFADSDWKMESFRFANYCCVSRARPDLRALLVCR